MNKSDFSFELPEELIAQEPLKNRQESRLLVLHKDSGNLEHRHFYDLTDYLKKGDCLVINETRVMPARLLGHIDGTTTACEVLLLKDLGESKWECIVFPGKKMRVGAHVIFGDGRLKGDITDVLENGNRVISFLYSGIFLEILEALGTMPLPHYITTSLSDKERYQTVYSKNIGSAAAPTAGLHFTDELLKKIADIGVQIARITLHVGLGTFRPVKVDNITEHTMHSEEYDVPEDAAKIINNTRKNGGRVFAVGTTSCRTLESTTDENGVTKAGHGNTNIFIYPGYTFKGVDAIITNFHLPESTLIMLISAFYDREKILKAYNEAILQKYRFYSFGDAMLIGDWSGKKKKE